MFGFLTKSSAWGLVMRSDLFTWAILLFLFLTSVVCVAVIALKFAYFKKELARISYLINKSRHFKLDDFITMREELKGSVGGAFLADGLEELQAVINNSAGAITEQEINRFDLSLGQSADNLLMEAENYLPVLGVSAAVSPLVGLFGTIWGLIHSFVSIGAEKSADLSVVAPGMAMALITTLAGLIVAIPAMIFFHYYSNKLRKLEQQIGHLSDKFFAVSVHTLTNNLQAPSLQSSREGEL